MARALNRNITATWKMTHADMKAGIRIRIDERMKINGLTPIPETAASTTAGTGLRVAISTIIEFNVVRFNRYDTDNALLD
jgi:hypothetical protein